MKVFVALALLVVSCSAWPQHKGLFDVDALRSNIESKNERIISDQIISVIQDLSISIREAGLDPLHIENAALGYALPVPVIFNIEAFIEELHFTGLSDIVVNDMSFSILTYRLTLDIELPKLALSIGQSSVSASLFENPLSASASGSIEIVRPRIAGNVRVSVGIISGISLRSVDLDFTLGGIESNLNVNILGADISSPLNNLLGHTIPTTIRDYRHAINELIDIVVFRVIDGIL